MIAQPSQSVRLKPNITLCVFSLSLFFAWSISAQQSLPSEILGYKIHREAITVTDASGSFDPTKKREVSVRVGQPDIVDVSLNGITLSVSAELNKTDKSGEVHFMTFRDFRVNDVPVEIDEYKEPFTFRKGENINLPKPATLFLPTGRILNAAWKEITSSKKEWTVTGRVFVFGKFRRFGFAFKRVVPVDIKLTVKNPLRELRSETPF